MGASGSTSSPSGSTRRSARRASSSTCARTAAATSRSGSSSGCPRSSSAPASAGSRAPADLPLHRLPRPHLVALLNETSASDGDIFPYYFREGRARAARRQALLGRRRGHLGRGPLLDGGTIFVPLQGTNDVDGNWVIEGEGVTSRSTPDIEVENDPEAPREARRPGPSAHRGGRRDPQLERQLEQLELRAPVLRRGVGRHQLADARGVDDAHPLEVEEDLLLPRVEGRYSARVARRKRRRPRARAQRAASRRAARSATSSGAIPARQRWCRSGQRRRKQGEHQRSR
jgi:hypothetical protein